MAEDGQPKNIGKALVVDAASTILSGLTGTSSGTAYIESAAGIKEGGRTGLTGLPSQGSHGQSGRFGKS